MNGYAEIFWGAFKLRAHLARPAPNTLAFYEYRRNWNLDIARGFGFDVQATGPRAQARSLLVSNHAGFADIMSIVITSPASAMLNFVSKKEIGELPIFGWHMQPHGDVLFDRNNPDARKAVVTDALARIAQGFSVVLFPEGTRSRNGVPKAEIRPALIEAAIKEGVTIHPLAVAGTHNRIELPHLRKHRHKIRLVYGEPRATFKNAGEVWSEVRDLWEAARKDAR